MLKLLPTRQRLDLSHETIQPEIALRATPHVLPGVEAIICPDGKGHVRREVREPNAFDRFLKKSEAKTNCLFNLDAFGAIFWSHINGKNTLSDIARIMSEEFDWDREATENSVLEFSRTLVCRGLIAVQMKGKRRNPRLRL